MTTKRHTTYNHPSYLQSVEERDAQRRARFHAVELRAIRQAAIAAKLAWVQS